MIYPNPELYESWQDWAKAFIDFQSRAKENIGIQLRPAYTSTATGGSTLPSAAATGVVLFSATGGEPIYSHNGVWKRMSTATEIAT